MIIIFVFLKWLWCIPKFCLFPHLFPLSTCHQGKQAWSTVGLPLRNPRHTFTCIDIFSFSKLLPIFFRKPCSLLSIVLRYTLFFTVLFSFSHIFCGEFLFCHSPWGKKASPSLLCVSGGIWQFTFWHTAPVTRLKTCKQQTLSSWDKWGEPVKAKTITASPPPADTSQSQKKIRFWQDWLFKFLPRLYQDIPGRFQTGRCIWAPHHSQDPCVPWSLASLRLHARMQASERKLKSEMCSRDPKNIRVAEEEEAAMRLRGTCQRRSAGVCWPINSLQDLGHTKVDWDTLEIHSKLFGNLGLLGCSDPTEGGVLTVGCWLLQCRCLDHRFPPPYSSMHWLLYT